MNLEQLQQQYKDLNKKEIDEYLQYTHSVYKKSLIVIPIASVLGAIATHYLLPSKATGRGLITGGLGTISGIITSKLYYEESIRAYTKLLKARSDRRHQLYISQLFASSTSK